MVFFQSNLTFRGKVLSKLGGGVKHSCGGLAIIASTEAFTTSNAPGVVKLIGEEEDIDMIVDRENYAKLFKSLKFKIE